VTLPIYNNKKKDLKAKEELWKVKIISPCKNIIFKNKISKRKPKFLQDIITLL